MKEVIIKKFYCDKNDKRLFLLYCNKWNISLRKIANEFEVSASYLSEVINGKKAITNKLKIKLKDIINIK